MSSPKLLKYHKPFLWLLIVLPPVIIILIQQLSKINYIISSIYKIVFLVPLFYRIFIYKRSLKESIKEGLNFDKFKTNLKNNLLVILVLGLVFFGTFFLLKSQLDFSRIAEQLGEKVAVNAQNIVFIGLYVIFINSFLEEYFWGGFMYKELRKVSTRLSASVLTGIGFALHHLMIIYSFLEWYFVGIMFLGLVGFGMFMNHTLEKKELFSCWFIHAAMDVIMISIGLIIFGIV